MAQSKVVVKKIRAFPFPVQFKTATGAFSGQIVKLTMQGFLAEVSITSLQPLEKLECAFQFPVLLTNVAEPIVVVKIYNQWSGGVSGTVASGSAPAAGAPATAPVGSGVVHLVEMHFISLSQGGQATISSFLRTVQKHGL